MKSFPRIITPASQSHHESWNPTELYVEQAPVAKDEKKDQVLALFGHQIIISDEKKEKRIPSVLHPMETSQEFSAWLPGQMDWQPPFAGRDAWTFIETFEGSLPILEPETPDEEPEPQTLRQEEVFDPDKEAGAILRQARAQADEIILESQKTADNLLSQAQDEIDHQKKEAYQQGLDEAHREIQSTLQASQVMIEEIHTWQKELMLQGEQILVDMVKEISQTMFGEGAKLDANALQVNLNRVMESAQGLGDLNVFLNPRDARLLDPSWSEYQLLITGDKVKVIPSENITPGGCFVKGSMGSVDARVETQLASVIKSLEENKDNNE
jgi:flagellar assembly protein FliH